MWYDQFLEQLPFSVMLSDLAFGWKRGWISANKNKRDNLKLAFTQDEEPKIAAYWRLRDNVYIRLHAIVHLYIFRVIFRQYLSTVYLAEDIP